MRIRYTSLLLIYLMLNSILLAQDGELNYRYWQMRQRFVDQYVKIGDCHGCSLPVSRKTTPDSWGVDKVIFDDESVRILGWYISVLATENHLLGMINQTTETNSEELYYALKTIDRLDKYAEFINYNVRPNNSIFNLSWDGQHFNTIYPEYTLYSDLDNNLNGFFIREDVPPDMYHTFEVERLGNRGEEYYDGHYTNIIENKSSEMSQDELFHLMIGLAFTSKYVDELQIFNGVQLRDYARQICQRLISHYSDFWILYNPLTNQQTQNYDTLGNPSYNTGNSMAFSYLVSTAASVISGNPLPESSLNQWDYDMNDNPYKNEASVANRELWTSGIASGPILAVLPSSNQVMIYTLMAISGVPRNPSSHVKQFLDHDCNYKVDGYSFFGNIYRALHENDEDVGFTLNELHDRLSLLTCQGPYYYCESNNGSDCNTILRYQPQWSFDNSFINEEPHNQDEFDGSNFAGHFNATDWMLAYNIYLILSNTESDFVSGIDRQLNATWPTFEYGIYSENNNSPAIWGAAIQKGSILNPNYIYGKYIHSSEKYLSQEVTSTIDNIDFNGQPNTQETSNIYGDGEYKAKDLISLEPGFEVAIGAQFSAEIGEEECNLATNHRIRNPSNTDPIGPKFQAINHHLDEYYKKTLPTPIRQYGNEGIQVFPNPCKSGFNLKINSYSSSTIKLTLFDLNGKTVQDFKTITLQQGLNQPNLTFENIPAGVYQLSIVGNEINSVLRLVKM